MASTISAIPWFAFRNTTLQHSLYQSKPPPSVTLSATMKRRSVLFLLSRIWLYLGGIQLFLRLLYVTYRLNVGDTFDQLRTYHLSIIFAIEYSKFLSTSTLWVITPPLWLFAFTIDYLAFFRSDHYIVKLGHQLMVDNGEDLLTLNRRQLGKRPQLDCRKPHRWLLQWWRLIRAIWRSTNLRFKHRQLDEFPNISPRLRARLVIYSTAIEWTCMAVFVLLVLIVVTFAIIFLVMVYNQGRPAISLFIFTFDVIIVCCTGLNALRVGFLTIHFGLVLSFVSNYHIGELNAQLRRVFCQPHPLARYRYLNYFYREYARLKRMAEHTNVHFVSPLYAVMFATVIWLSIVAITNLIYTQLQLSEQLLMALYFVTSVGIPLQGSAALIGWSQSFYSTEPLLFRAQYQLGKGNKPFQHRLPLNLAKVRLMAFYEIVCTTDKFRFTVGPFGDISKQALYEFSFAYSGMVMFVADMIRNE